MSRIGPGVINPHTGMPANPIPAGTPITRSGTPYGPTVQWGPRRKSRKDRKEKKSRKDRKEKKSRKDRKDRKNRKASRKSRKNRK